MQQFILSDETEVAIDKIFSDSIIPARRLSFSVEHS